MLSHYNSVNPVDSVKNGGEVLDRIHRIDRICGNKKNTPLDFRRFAAKYNAYRAWVDRVAGSDFAKRQAVKDSANAWFSYALDLAAVLEKTPVAGDLKIDALAAAGESGSFELTVSLKDVR